MPPISPDLPLANLWRRAAAAMLDVVVLAIPVALLSMVHPVLALLAAVLYGALFESSARRATPGKRWCGIVATASGGERLPFTRAVVRNAVKYSAAYLVGVTYGASLAIAAAPFATGDHRRGLHDHAARSAVRREARHGLSDIAVGLLATVVPLLFAVGVLPILMNPSYEDASRKEVNRAIEASHPHRMRTEEFFAKNGALPETLAQIGLEPLPPSIAAFSYRQGRMTLVLPQRGARDREQLTFTPEVRGTQVTWRCTAAGMRKERVPALCRDE